MTFFKQKDYSAFEVDSLGVVKVFGWLFYGLLLTFVTAGTTFLLARNGVISADTYVGLLIASSIIYIIFSFVAIFAMSLTKSKTVSIVIYSIYSLVLGIVLSSLFITCDVGNIFLALGVTSLVFGGMSLYGYFTKRDLTSFGSILTMILIGALFMSLINVILYFALGAATYTMLDIILSYVILGVIIGYVAFDVQRIKRAAESGQLANSMPIYLAFNLYTDFIYIFIRILSIIESNKN